MSIKIISNDSVSCGFKIVAPAPPSRLVQLIALTLQNMVKQAEFNKQQEIEMAKILYEFISSNAHLFSTPVLEAAKHLLEEITKAEMGFEESSPNH